MKGLMIAGVLLLMACGRAEPPPPLLLGEWKEDVTAPKYQSSRSSLKERTVYFFPDGTGATRSVHDGPTAGEIRTSFRWTLSADGRSLKTDTARDTVSLGGMSIEISGGPYVARIVVLSQTELRIDEPSEANGHFQRVR